MKFIDKVKKTWYITVRGFKNLYIDYFTENAVLLYEYMPHGGKKYLVFKYPIIAGGKVYSSIEELYNEDRARKAKKSKANDKKGRTSKKASN